MWQLLTIQMTVLDCSFPLIFWLSRVQNSVLQLVQFYFGSSPFYEAKNGPENVLNFSRACMHDREHFWSKKLFSMFLILKDMHFWGPVFFHSDFWLVPKVVNIMIWAEAKFLENLDLRSEHFYFSRKALKNATIWYQKLQGGGAVSKINSFLTPCLLELNYMLGFLTLYSLALDRGWNVPCAWNTSPIFHIGL